MSSINERSVRLVRAVAQTYDRMKSLSPVIAQNLDETTRNRSLKWSPTSCHYVVDCERQLEAALRGRSDIPELLEAFEGLAEENAPVGEIELRLIRIVAPYLVPVAPWSYFRPTRRAA